MQFLENGIFGSLLVPAPLGMETYGKCDFAGNLVNEMRKRVPVAIVLNEEAANNCHSYACENDQPSLHGRNVHRSLPLFVRDDKFAIREIRLKKALGDSNSDSPGYAANQEKPTRG
jgi:hypothetical protein